jgi:hypothetical protein
MLEMTKCALDICQSRHLSKQFDDNNNNNYVVVEQNFQKGIFLNKILNFIVFLF